MDKITASAETLMNQASMTASEYMHAAIRAIDQQFGSGYAQANPSLIGAYMNAAATDFGASVLTAATQDIAESLDRVATAIESMDS